MTLVVPSVGQVQDLSKILNQNFSLKLFSNNATLGPTNTAATFTEVAGGGYVAKVLTFANWNIILDNPSYATYPDQDFLFTGVTNAPGTIYGYYILDAGGVLAWAEGFDPALVPFTPIAGSLIRISPKLQIS